MKNKTYMLPYRFRKCGYGLIIASVLSFALGLLMANVWEIIPQTHTRFISMVMYLLFFLGIFVIVMTEEKDEDEMIDSIRRRSIATTAFIAFGIFVVTNLLMSFLHGFRTLYSHFPDGDTENDQIKNYICINASKHVCNPVSCQNADQRRDK